MTNTVGIDTPITKPLVHRASMGWWHPDVSNPSAEPSDIRDMVGDLRSTVAVVHVPDGFAMARGGVAQLGGAFPGPAFFPLAAFLPPLLPEDLGDSAFCTTHGLKYPYMTGAMANGIGSADIVEAMSRAGMLGSFGAAGLSIDRITQAIDRLQATLGDKPFCFNLIHSPNEPAHEAAVTDLYLRRGVKLVEACAPVSPCTRVAHHHGKYRWFRSHGSTASSRMSCSVLGSLPSSWRCKDARFSALAKSSRILVLMGTRESMDDAEDGAAADADAAVGVALARSAPFFPCTNSRATSGSTGPA